MIKSHTFNLVRVRGRFLKNHFGRPTTDKIIRWSLILGLGTLFLIGDYIFFFRIIQYLDGLPLKIGEELIIQLLNVIFLTFFAMLLFSSIIASLTIFYGSSDSEFLHSLPISPGSIIDMRLAQTVLNCSWVILVFALPIFIAYGYYFGVGGGYYLYLLGAFFPFILIPCIFGILGIMILMRYFPTDKAHQILSFMGLFFFAGLIMFLRFLSPEKFFDKQVSDEMIIAFVESLKAPEFGFLPSSWITRGVSQWVAGNVTEALVQMAYLYGAVLVFGGIFWWVSRKTYFIGWRLYQEVRSSPKKKNGKRGSRRRWLDFLPISPTRKALLDKDLKIFCRDPALWSQVFILIALVVVYIFNIMNLPLSNIILKNVVSVLNIGLVGFVLSALIARFVFSSTSLEGRKMWTICTSPVDMKSFLMGKFWMYLPPLLLIAEFLVVVSNYLLQVDPYVMKVSIVGVFLITTGLVGMGVGMGAMYPMFEYENISEIATGTGGILFMITSLLYVGLVLVLSARPMVVHFNEKFLANFIGGVEVPVFYGLIILLTVLVTLEPLRRGIRSLNERDF